MKANAPTRETGIAIAGNQGAAPVLEEDQHHHHDEEDGFGQRLHHFADGVAHERRGVKSDLVLQSGRKPFRQPVQLGTDGLVHVERIGGGQLGYADANAVVAVEAKPRAVIFGSQFR